MSAPEGIKQLHQFATAIEQQERRLPRKVVSPHEIVLGFGQRHQAPNGETYGMYVRGSAGDPSMMNTCLSVGLTQSSPNEHGRHIGMEFATVSFYTGPQDVSVGVRMSYDAPKLADGPLGEYLEPDAVMPLLEPLGAWATQAIRATQAHEAAQRAGWATITRDSEARAAYRTALIEDTDHVMREQPPRSAPSIAEVQPLIEHFATPAEVLIGARLDHVHPAGNFLLRHHVLPQLQPQS